MAISLGDAAAMALSFVFFVVVVGVGATVLTGIQNTQYTTAIEPSCTAALAASGQVNCTTIAWNATKNGLVGNKNLSDQSGVLGTIIGAAVIIGVLVSAFYFSQKN